VEGIQKGSDAMSATPIHCVAGKKGEALFTREAEIMDFSSFGKWMVAAGLGLVALGLLAWLMGKTGLPFGSLPGDIRIDRPRVTIHFPIVTWILLSVILTVIVNLVLWLLRR
jgi:hypothetical protein